MYVPVVQRIEQWIPNPQMWVRFPPGMLLEVKMSNLNTKHLDKLFKETIQFLSDEDREIILDKVRESYEIGLNRKRFWNTVAEHLPFFSIIMLLLLLAGSATLMWLSISANYESLLKQHKKEAAEEIDALNHEILGIKKFSNESIQECVAKLVTCDCLNEGEK